jgi:uncharacterized protein YoxC
MQVLLIIVLIIAVIVVTIAIVVLVRRLLQETRKLGQASEDLSRVLHIVEDELPRTTGGMRAALVDVQTLTTQLTATTQRIEQVASRAEGLLDIEATATKVAKSSAIGLVSVYEGVRQGIKTLRGS